MPDAKRWDRSKLDLDLEATAFYVRSRAAIHEEHSHVDTLAGMADKIDAKRYDLQERVLTRLSLQVGVRAEEACPHGVEMSIVHAVLEELSRRGLAAQRGGWWRATQKGRADVV